MFDLDQFIVDCNAAVRSDRSHKLVREVVARSLRRYGCCCWSRRTAPGRGAEAVQFSGANDPQRSSGHH
jgi:hypothetical protein